MNSTNTGINLISPMISKVNHYDSDSQQQGQPSPASHQLNYHLDTLNDYIKVNEHKVDSKTESSLIKLNHDELSADFFDSIDIDDDCILSLSSDQLGDEMIDINNQQSELADINDDPNLNQTYHNSTNHSFNNDDCSINSNSGSVSRWFRNSSVTTPSPTSSIMTNAISNVPSPSITTSDSKVDSSVQVSSSLTLETSSMSDGCEQQPSPSLAVTSTNNTGTSNKHIPTSPLFSTEIDDIPRHTLCPLCDNSRSFCSSSSVTRHLRSVHKLADLMETKGSYCLFCNEFFEDLDTFFNDLQTKHQFVAQNPSDLRLTKHFFKSFDDFMQWKKNHLEAQTGCIYERCYTHEYPRSVYFKCSAIKLSPNVLKQATATLQSNVNQNGKRPSDDDGEVSNDGRNNNNTSNNSMRFSNPCDARLYPCTSSIKLLFRTNGVEAVMVPFHIGHTLSTGSNLTSTISSLNSAAASMNRLKNSPTTVKVGKSCKKFSNAEVSVNSLPEMKNVKLLNSASGNTSGSATTTTAATLIQIPAFALASQSKSTLVNHESLVSTLATETSFVANASSTSIPVSSSIFYSNQQANTEQQRTSISVYSDHFLNHDTILSQSSSNNRQDEVIDESANFQLTSPTEANQDLVIVSLEKGVQLVQEQIKPRKDQLRQRFEHLLEQCFTESDLKLIESAISSAEQQIQLIPKP